MIGLVMVAADPPRHITPPPPRPAVSRPAPKTKAAPKVESLATPARILAHARALVGTQPAYNQDPGWCWAFVDQVLRDLGLPAPVDEAAPTTTRPVPGDVVYFFLPGQAGGFVGHVGIVEHLDGELVHVIDGNGKTSSTTIARAAYPRSAVDVFTTYRQPF